MVSEDRFSCKHETPQADRVITLPGNRIGSLLLFHRQIQNRVYLISLFKSRNRAQKGAKNFPRTQGRIHTRKNALFGIQRLNDNLLYLSRVQPPVFPMLPPSWAAVVLVQLFECVSMFVTTAACLRPFIMFYTSPPGAQNTQDTFPIFYPFYILSPAPLCFVLPGHFSPLYHVSLDKRWAGPGLRGPVHHFLFLTPYPGVSLEQLSRTGALILSKRNETNIYS